MKILAVETATRCHSVAIVDDHQVLAEETQRDCASHASVLVPTIDRLLQTLGLSLAQLDGLAVSLGPGSFTGLRVGLSTMMGFRLATQLPLVTVPTLEAMAWNVKGEPRPICPILKASRGEVYWAMFQWQGDNLMRVSDDCHGPLIQLVESIEHFTVLFGEGWEFHASELKELLGEKAIPGPDKAMHPSAISVAFSSLSSFHLRQYAGEHLSPRYIQRAEAEVQWEAKFQKNPVIS
ncbi:tRNA (adenosine(37)-N6)-threonylcarbamoyltransferase complex dimerization subunit type 1 TsaB [Candidatus Nitronereus thalassa]|uniref:tRNA (Adenosine(37)-N6)-threonylcarbamoyltransferase complex dimerization subunit type 1 TsaB n=1 Tax=Candidatus Nitronereus thalassa TaxID=3020898 RepID=A0ABU3K4M6_9BACT|nr:tRNA (adenosine(37)-N6)-threonylcarbamoyltransferase complex dimerization subunit type 1 TsaB [Candidatus Nitronereus thalassa]MDT7041370.1 tRNA (adenosine(37)-N6)-threonylcarbamoyltransferase complex dimerization subunit type 1 TsaB [Candidatus Nitronereus thalassa]